ncbi:hypothetical protein AALP_AA8G080600 [Arabis alpina]|uniref:Uncharacterized protein n=1 Tax=Arabis alpina TaxID=50452 RepID=A0A087G5Q1_ARAAL|nr:hypothetical protein AALP_AA8G080600 [Arabis alpina]
MRMSLRGKSNFESFLAHISPTVRFQTKSRGGEEEEETKPYVGLRNIWSAYEEWSCYALGVPVKLDHLMSGAVTQYYVPTLSAIQIFTNEPIVDGGSDSSPRSVGTDSHLYFEFNETMGFDERAPLIVKVDELAEEHHGLKTLTSTDLSQESWFSVAWSPIYQIPKVRNVKALSALSVSFLTYHSLTPTCPETFPRKKNVVLSPFGVVTSKLSGNVWIKPGSSDEQNINTNEESAASWLGNLMFEHSDFDMFMAEKASDVPLPSGK